VMYLGGGCLQCVQQLKALVPIAPKFKEAGIEVLAVGTDTPEKLKEWIDRMRNDGVTFPFPLLSDPSATAFKAYRAFDDFEGFPLHGVFLVDASGKLRWQEISAAPFTDLTFLLNEAKRLLGL